MGEFKIKVRERVPKEYEEIFKEYSLDDLLEIWKEDDDTAIVPLLVKEIKRLLIENERMSRILFELGQLAKSRVGEE